jgi:hypothetical protein
LARTFLGAKSGGSSSAQKARGKKQDRTDEFEEGFEGYPDQTKGQRNEPDDWKKQ